MLQNDKSFKGKPVPKGGLLDNRHTGMTLDIMTVANPRAGAVGGVGTGSGIIDGGTLGKKNKGKAT